MPSPVPAESIGLIGQLVLDRPESFNALDLATVRSLRAAVGELGDARVVVLRSEGRAFCAGGDLRAFHARNLGEYVAAVAEKLHAALLALWQLPAVVIAQVHGVAAGAGVPLAAAADIIVAARTARFDLAYLRAGLTPDGGSSLLIPSIGLHRTLRLALLSPAVSAEEALAMGLVAEVVEPAALTGRVAEIVEQLRAGPHQALVAARRLRRNRAVPDPAAALALETAAIVAQTAGPDAAEGIAAFLDKRSARFA